MKLFYDEVKEKKRTASGVHSKKGKNGFVGTMRFPSDYLKGKAKREYQQNGKVKVWNMYAEINKEEFFEWNEEQQKNALIKWRDETTNKDIMERLEITSSGAFHNLLDKLDVPKKRRGAGRRKPKENKQKALQIVPESEKVRAFKPPEKQEEEKPNKKGMSFNWNMDKAEMKEIKDILTKLEFLVENDQEKKFAIKVELQELLD